jgi:hypothetical protein
MGRSYTGHPAWGNRDHGSDHAIVAIRRADLS